MWFDGWSMGWWMLFAGILTILFWGGIIVLVVWGIKKLAERGPSVERHSLMEIARERYARGEITKEQFEQLKKDLS